MGLSIQSPTKPPHPTGYHRWKTWLHHTPPHAVSRTTTIEALDFPQVITWEKTSPPGLGPVPRLPTPHKVFSASPWIFGMENIPTFTLTPMDAGNVYQEPRVATTPRSPGTTP